MFRRLLLLFTDPELRSKVFKVILLLVAARLLAFVPIPVFDVADISDAINSDAALGLLNTISGGSYGQLSFVMLGVGPFITASIVMQLLGVIVPRIREIQREEGEAGQQKINRWTRYLSIPLGALSAWGILQFLANGDLAGGAVIALPAELDTNSITVESFWYWFVVIASMTAGSTIIMWIGEIITEMKMGNGVSLMILVGIIARLPEQLADFWRDNAVASLSVEIYERLVEKPALLFNLENWNKFLSESAYWQGARNFVFLTLSFIVILLFVVFINDAVRKILVVYSRRGHKEGKSRTLGNVKADLPIKVNIAGVLPIIFAISFILFPTILSRFLETSNLPDLADGARQVEEYLSTQQRQDITVVPDEIESLGQKFTILDDKEDVENVQDFDATLGQEIFGFTLSNEKDVDNIFFRDTFLEFKTPSTNFSFLPEQTIVFQGVLAYTFFYFILIIFFTYFYTSTVAFKTEEVAENLQRREAYIPGFRPGLETENYLSYVSNRLNVAGSMFLALIAVTPFILGNAISDQQNSGLVGIAGGTTLLILVSVTIETLKQLEAQATSIDYERFTKY